MLHFFNRSPTAKFKGQCQSSATRIVRISTISEDYTDGCFTDQCVQTIRHAAAAAFSSLRAIYMLRKYR